MITVHPLRLNWYNTQIMKKANSPVIGILWAVIVVCGVVIGSLVYRMHETAGRCEGEVRSRLLVEEQTHELKQKLERSEALVESYRRDLDNRDRRIAVLEQENAELVSQTIVTSDQTDDVVTEPEMSTLPAEVTGETYEVTTP
jgi:uncharacterized membrane-anchored protein YhcB (DUF1043 family)